MAGLITFIRPDAIFDEKNDTDADSLEKNFLQPSQSAKPQVMWFWMNGHISREGITLDLEAMKRAGIGGVLNFDAGV
ncbi:MAG: glycosyl hydrolase, partial [Flavisolibacter sp.]